MSETDSKWDALEYDEKFSFVYEYGEDLLSLLKPKANERILDLGCGTGQLTELISRSGANVIGLDNSQEMIQAAIEKYPGMEFVKKDASDFQFDEPFDAIFSNATLHWVLDYTECIKSMYDNLKPGGRLVLEFGGRANIQNITTSLSSVLEDRGYQDQANLQLWYFPSIGEYSSALEEQGFRVISAWHFQRPTVLQSDLIGWLDMFANPFFKDIPAFEVQDIKTETQEKARSSCFQNGQWIADYCRIRIIAEKSV